MWEKSKPDPQFQTQIPYQNIPGLKEVGFDDKQMMELMEKPKGTSFQKSCEKILELLKSHKSSWPFKDAVKREEVPDYYDVIKNPIDLSKIEQKLKNGLYQSKTAFTNDINLIFKNAKLYN